VFTKLDRLEVSNTVKINEWLKLNKGIINCIEAKGDKVLLSCFYY